MKVLIASAPHADTFGYSMPPPGLLRLGGALRDAGIHVELDDLAHRLAAGEIRGDDGLATSAAAHLVRGQVFPPEVAGLSVMGATLPVALLILEELRRAWPRTTLLLGGPGMNGTDLAVLERFPQVDAVVRGEAEITLVELCEALLEGTPMARVEGVTARDGGRPVRAPDRPQIQDLHALPAPAWDLLPPIARYKEITGETDGLVPIDSGRGCVYDCSFCSIGRTWSRRSRPLPAARLADEVVALREMPAARRAYLCHDIFGARRDHAVEFCETLLEREIDVPWEVRARADHLDADLLELMGRAGCDRVLLGIESASPAIRRAHQKGMADDIDLMRVVDDCVSAGVTPILSMILGLPGESDADLELSLAFCADASLRGGVNLSLHLVNPQPGCALGDEHGANATRVDGVPPDMALGAGDSAGERALIAAHPDLFSTWALLPMEPSRTEELVWLAKEFAEVVMRHPRSMAALRRARPAEGVLGLARALRADGRSFESFAPHHAPAEERELVEGLVAWELAQLRVAARGALAPREGRWRLAAALVDSPFDLPAAAEALVAGDEEVWPPAPDPAGPRSLGVVSPPVDPGRLAQVRTVRLAEGAARLARAVERAPRAGDGAAEALAARLAAPSLAAPLTDLARAGVLVPPLGWQSADADGPGSPAAAGGHGSPLQS